MGNIKKRGPTCGAHTDSEVYCPDNTAKTNIKQSPLDLLLFWKKNTGHMFAVACWLCSEVGVKVRARSLTFCLENVLAILWGSCAEHVRNTNSTVGMQKSERRWHQNECLRPCWKTNTVNKNQPLFVFHSISISQRGNVRKQTLSLLCSHAWAHQSVC